ncbi:hypothetical protein TOPH_03326 [Tolypocladium ophioglossoides CBS 100239]|uniref:Uncharacterized protein n=1 Tax=Tolypocladium ophioglossoides (strain CBS 100239) TaxID=1163406 RepID=A0A0L0NCP6_TOLOC|nr:hypothetical protein TOPH_03326 [Tolypocladium ophioglossoides CBS 100239]
MISRPELTTKLQSFLTSEWTRKNTPKGLETAWTDALSPTGNETPKTFLRHGFKPFLAYYLGTIESTSHKKWEKTGDKLRQTLDNLPSDVLQEIAIELRDTQSHPTVDQAIERMMTTAVKRRRKFQRPLCTSEANAKPPGLQATDADEACAATPPETSPITTPMDDGQTRVSGTWDTTHTSNNHNLTIELGRTASPLPTTLGAVGQGQLFTNASPQGITQIFPPYMCGAIRKTGAGAGSRASVTMGFPYQQYGGIHCLMSLSIVPRRLVIVAKELFGMTLDIDGGMQYIVSERGGKLLPMPSLNLQGASKEGIILMLGVKIRDAIEGSPQRETEISLSVMHTSCATLTISNNPEDDGQLNLNFGLKEGLVIKDLLYPDCMSSNPSNVDTFQAIIPYIVLLCR